MIPFLDRLDQVAACLNALLLQVKPDTVFLLIDDGSMPPALHNAKLKSLLSQPNVHLISHQDNLGVAATRNSGLHWCKQHHIDIFLMIDSDCLPEENFIEEHLRLHKEHPNAVCIGGQIIGQGKSIWARLDGITSWVHATPHQKQSNAHAAEFRAVNHPYHLPTTNFSAKLDKLPKRDFVFDERLKSGEDCLLIRELRRSKPFGYFGFAQHKSAQGTVYFSSTPTVYHQDRETLCEVFQHHYEWGHHQYFIQLGGDLSPRCFNPVYRTLFVLLFLPLSPLFALVGALLNCKPLLFNQPRALVFFPLIYGLWLGKAIAVLEAAIRPQACLRNAREHISYEEAR